jgi:hypothetical protein
MILSNRLGVFCKLVAVAVGVWGFARNATAIVIYQDNFDGSSSSFLNGLPPDVDNNGGTNTWSAFGSAANVNGYKADGTLASGSVSQGAWLPFTPTSGNIYTLSVELIGVGPQSANTAWYAMGFAKSLPADPQSGQNRFLEGNTIGRAWMLFRATTPQGTAFNQSQRGDATTGAGPTGTAQAWAAGAPANGGDVDMQIVLDTTQATWTADYFAKRPADGSYLEVSPGALPLLAQNIGAVGFARTTNSTSSLSGKITNFDLSGVLVVPEPASSALLALGAISFGIAANRKKSR